MFKGAILSWIAVPVSVGVFLLFLAGLISLSYHPIAPGIHLVPIRIALAATGVAACIALAIRHSGKMRRSLVLRNGLELAAVPVILWILFHICAASYQQPDHLRMTFGGDKYAIPRIYEPVQSAEDASYDYIRVTLCRKSGLPVYAEPCTATSYIKLMTKPMIERYDVYSSLDHAGATYDGDVITDRGSIAGTLPDGSFEYDEGAYRTRFLLDRSGQLERFADCYPLIESCTVTARTPRGILTFRAEATETSETNFWREEEEAWLAVFDGWKCAEATCGGRFD